MTSIKTPPITLDPTPYTMDPVRGFLPAHDPLQRLPVGFAAWERIASRLPLLLATNRLRQTVDLLPPLNFRRLSSPQQLERAMLLLSMCASAYVWGGTTPATVIPSTIAVPLWQVAEALGRPPMAAYTSVPLYNWRRSDPESPVTVENITILNSFSGGVDEQWFYAITVAIEAAGAPALHAVVEAQKAVLTGRVDAMMQCLQQMASALAEMYALCLRLTDKCDPAIFYHSVRPFLAGWPAHGVIYEGVNATPQHFAGGSAAQSPLWPSLDAGLGIQHNAAETPFLQAMRTYMSPAHRHLIEVIQSGPSIRQFVREHTPRYPLLGDAYNTCIQEMSRFRKQHLKIAVRYIVQQAPRGQGELGTGGTTFVPFLQQLDRETRACLLVT